MACITSSSKGCTTPGGACSQHTASTRHIFRPWTLRNEAGRWLAIRLESTGHREGGLRKGGQEGPLGPRPTSTTAALLGLCLEC